MDLDNIEDCANLDCEIRRQRDKLSKNYTELEKNYNEFKSYIEALKKIHGEKKGDPDEKSRSEILIRSVEAEQKLVIFQMENKVLISDLEGIKKELDLNKTELKKVNEQMREIKTTYDYDDEINDQKKQIKENNKDINKLLTEKGRLKYNIKRFTTKLENIKKLLELEKLKKKPKKKKSRRKVNLGLKFRELLWRD